MALLRLEWVMWVGVVLGGVTVLDGHPPSEHLHHKNSVEPMVVEPTGATASDVPDRIIATLSGDAATSFAVTWRSKESASGVAEIAVAGDNSKFVMDAKTELAETSRLKTSLGEVSMHTVTFKDLTPGTLYCYRVGNERTVPLSEKDAKSAEEHLAKYAWSEWIHFRTAKTFEGEVTPLKFVYVGDAQNDVKSHWSRLIRTAFLDAPGSCLMIHAGDLINSANNDHEWGQWFEAGSFAFSTVPQLCVPGNHEYGIDLYADRKEGEEPKKKLTRRWAQQFEYPKNGPEGSTENVYYVDVQGVRFIGLDSNIDPKPQGEWLRKVLAENPNRWTIVMHHHPIYSTGKGRDNSEIRETFQPIYDEFKVDLVLQGHDHTYGRTEPIMYGNVRVPDTNEAVGLRARDGDQGTVYVVSVSGPKMYNLTVYDDPSENPFAKRGEQTQLYQVIEVTQDAIRYQAKTVTGTLYDEFVIEKDADGGKRVGGK